MLKFYKKKRVGKISSIMIFYEYATKFFLYECHLDCSMKSKTSKYPTRNYLIVKIIMGHTAYMYMYIKFPKLSGDFFYSYICFYSQYMIKIRSLHGMAQIF